MISFAGCDPVLSPFEKATLGWVIKRKLTRRKTCVESIFTIDLYCDVGK